MQFDPSSFGLIMWNICEVEFNILCQVVKVMFFLFVCLVSFSLLLSNMNNGVYFS